MLSRVTRLFQREAATPAGPTLEEREAALQARIAEAEGKVTDARRTHDRALQLLASIGPTKLAGQTAAVTLRNTANDLRVALRKTNPALRESCEIIAKRLDAAAALTEAMTR